VALDKSPEMLAEARRRLASWRDRLSFVEADLAGPLPDVGPFGVIFSTAVFHWIRDHDALFRSLASMLRPGGRLVAQWGGTGNIASVLAAMRTVGLPTDRWTLATEEQTVERLGRAGFRDVEVWSHPDPAVFDTRAQVERYLETVVLFEALDQLHAESRRQVITQVAERLPESTIDYVRINVDATLAGSAVHSSGGPARAGTGPRYV
jgi:trans-aconitate 2-methyltransferase